MVVIKINNEWLIGLITNNKNNIFDIILLQNMKLIHCEPSSIYHIACHSKVRELIEESVQPEYDYDVEYGEMDLLLITLNNQSIEPKYKLYDHNNNPIDININYKENNNDIEFEVFFNQNSQKLYNEYYFFGQYEIPSIIYRIPLTYFTSYKKFVAVSKEYVIDIKSVNDSMSEALHVN